jgi:hypothetical protein
MMQFDAKVEPPGTAPNRMVGSVMTGKERQHRVVTDAVQKSYFGYDFRVERKGEAYQVRIEPLNLTPEELRDVSVAPNWTKLSLPNYPVIPDARVGDTVAIDVLVNPSTGHRVVDYISFLKRTTDSGAPRDFEAADAALELNAPKVRINGRLEPASATFGRGSLSGPNVWFYIPGFGRYVVSLLPKEQYGFGHPQKAGQVAGQYFTFTDAGVVFHVECDRRIAPGLGTYNLYVSHNAVWQPGGADAKAPLLWGAY